jgi:DNA-binding CsgD family transcriptional regulator
MNLSGQSLLHLIDLAYEAVEKPETWKTLYQQICEATGARSVHMLGIDNRNGTLSYSDGANLPVQGELAYMQRYRRIDPRMPKVMERPLYGWLHCHEEFDDNYVAQDPFYQEFLIPNGRRYVSGCKVVDSSEATVVFSTLCDVEQGPLPPEAIDFLNRLMPHLARACRIGIKNFVYSTQALVGHALVNKLRQPVVLLTTAAEVIHVNEAATRLLQATRIVRIENGKLELPPHQQQDFVARCEEMERRHKSGDLDASDHVGQFQSLRLKADKEAPEETLYSFLTMLPPQDMMGTFGLRPVVMLFFYHPESAPPIDPTILFAAFGLSPAECRVAMLLADGLSLKEIAETLGTQHETVRKQLRAIFQKTSTKRQPDLIRLLLHLPHHFG